MSGKTEAKGQEPRAKIGIISMGDMGSALASLLIANGYVVATNCTGRSQDTIDRAITVGAELLPTDEALITQCDVILSVVPPAQAAATAERIITAFKSVSSGPNPRCTPLYFADMNAISPSTVKSIAAQFTTAGLDPDHDVRFVDGCILGVTPSRKQQTGPAAQISAASASTEPVVSFPQEDILHDPTTGWSYPLLPTSGPWSFTDESTFPYPYGNHFASTLHIEHMLSDPDPNSSGAEKQQTSSSSEIGQASALKNVYASLAKGFAALSLLSLSTAHSLRILPSFLSSLERLAPSRLNTMTRYVTTLPPKAYRWVREMEEISKTFTDEEVGWNEDKEDVFKHVAGVFRFVADETVLGQEKVGKRRRGLDLEDLCQAMGEGLEGRRKRRAVEKEGEGSEE